MIERLWYGEGSIARAARVAMTPLAWAFAGIIAARLRLYRRRWLAVSEAGIPTLSVGNLTVGGTGKTPLAAWFAGRLATSGARPAIVLRGYGEDEPLVHAELNPGIPVVRDPDRAAGVRTAATLGADVAVLDDAFQHLALARTADVVVISADRWTHVRRRLPVGPWREGIGATTRASLVIVTRKAASTQQVDDAVGAVTAVAPGLPIAVVSLAHRSLVRIDTGETRGLSTLLGAPVLAVAAIGDPQSFASQLRSAGAAVTEAFFRDHHRFAERDIASLAARATPETVVVCTLKDAVKLRARWPRHVSPPWYVSQRIEVERGGAEIDSLLSTVLQARRAVNVPSSLHSRSPDPGSRPTPYGH